MHRIGEDIAERLDGIPAQFRVIVTRRPRYGCRACEGAVVQAPARLIEGGLPTEALVAHVLVGNTPTTYRCTGRARSTLAKSYLAEVLSRLVNPPSHFDQLMPWAYADPVASKRRLRQLGYVFAEIAAALVVDTITPDMSLYLLSRVTKGG